MLCGVEEPVFTLLVEVFVEDELVVVVVDDELVEVFVDDEPVEDDPEPLDCAPALPIKVLDPPEETVFAGYV